MVDIYHLPLNFKGIGLSGGPWYVVAKNCDDNTVFISKEYYATDKIRDTFAVRSPHWINEAPQTDLLQVKLRHGAFYNTASLTLLGNDRYKVQLSQRDQGIAEGQYAVFYEGTRCLGGGVIERYDE